MKATLTFNLPEEQEEFNDAVKGSDYKYCIEKIQDYLRRELKYNQSLTSEQYATIESIREEFNGILTNNDINL